MELSVSLKRDPSQSLLKGKVIATLFFEPSTRTRLSLKLQLTVWAENYWILRFQFIQCFKR